MSFLNPFSGLLGLAKVPAFLRALHADLVVLFEPDLTPTVTLPPRSRFPDPATHAAAVASLICQRRFALVRQAVRKQAIRETLWQRFGICYGLLGVVVVPFWCCVVILYLACMVANPAIYHWLTPSYWMNQLAAFF